MGGWMSAWLGGWCVLHVSYDVSRVPLRRE